MRLIQSARGGSAGEFVSLNSGRVATSNVAVTAPERYRISGPTLMMEISDGLQQSRVIVAAPASIPVKSIWLDGDGYFHR